MKDRNAGAVNVFQTFQVEQKSPFDIDKLSSKLKYRNTDWSIPEAFLCILIKAAMADGVWDDQESETIKLVAGRSRALNTLSPEELAAANNTVNERIANRPEALQEACETLPADMCLPVFAHCVDIVLADGELLEEESKFLQDIMQLLDIPADNARRVMEVLLLKAQY